MKKGLALAVLLFVAACANQPIYNVASRTMPPNAKAMSMEQIERAIVQAGQLRHWRVQNLEPGRLRATQDQAKHLAVVEITFDQNSYSINMVRTAGLNEDGATISRHYNTWIHNLENDIQVLVTKAMRF